MWSWTPGHKPMCDPSGPTIDDYKALPGRIPGAKMPFTYQGTTSVLPSLIGVAAQDSASPGSLYTCTHS